jgi:hypothetical protein
MKKLKFFFNRYASTICMLAILITAALLQYVEYRTVIILLTALIIAVFFLWWIIKKLVDLIAPVPQIVCPHCHKYYLHIKSSSCSSTYICENPTCPPVIMV